MGLSALKWAGSQADIQAGGKKAGRQTFRHGQTGSNAVTQLGRGRQAVTQSHSQAGSKTGRPIDGQADKLVSIRNVWLKLRNKVGNVKIRKMRIPRFCSIRRYF